jgi:maltooligosyltrehalose trehalohydrolase
MDIRQIELGAVLEQDGVCKFCVWAPYAQRVSVQLDAPDGREISMKRDRDGYHRATVDGVAAGTLYWYLLDGTTHRPDPASRSQPQGVHGPSAVVSPAFEWTDRGWHGLRLEAYIFYELHIGTFTPEGTFEAVIPHLDALADLGITAIEIMPVAQFPGERNWGYDGTFPYAAQHSYGGVHGLKRLVDACHALGIAVVLDVVYNHLGPEGNYLHAFGPYFTDRYKTPWGPSLNFDGPHSDHVRRFFIENALYWITECHIDALRLDATQAMTDLSAATVMDALVAAVNDQREALNRRIHLIAETDRSDDRLLRPIEQGGIGLDAQWSDDVHHVIHAVLTGETFAYYHNFDRFENLVRAVRHGFVRAGQYWALHERRHGTFKTDLPARRFVVCAQNHDHVGNRINGDRLSHLLPFDALKLAAGLVLLPPYLPLLFMGEEYADDSRFLFFTDFSDPALQQAVREGRAREFAAFHSTGEPHDPQATETFQRSKLNHALRDQGRHAVLLALYKELIRLRKTVPALRHLDKDRMEVTGFERHHALFMRRWHERSDICVVFNVEPDATTVSAPIPGGTWRCVLASSDGRWNADGSGTTLEQTMIEADSPADIRLEGYAFVIYSKEE